MVALTSYHNFPILFLLCPLIKAMPQYQDGNQQHHQQPFDHFNPYSSFSDEMVMIRQSLPLHPFEKVLPDDQFETQIDDDDIEKGRFFFTVTYTETVRRGYLKTVYCTTSTTAISTCSPSGRRKRFSKGVRGLFYNEEEQQIKIDDDSDALLHTFTADEE